MKFYPCREAAVVLLGISVRVAADVSGEPCAIARDKYREDVLRNGPDVDHYIPAEVAYECLQSVPLHKEEALELVDSLEPYLSWQVDDAYTASPPEDSPFPGNNITEVLSGVRRNLTEGIYKGEYDFQMDLYEQVTLKSHDGHLSYAPDLLGIFWFSRPIQAALVSISSDGRALPDIRAVEDVRANRGRVVTHIDGQPAEQQLTELSRTLSQFRGVDSAYNDLFARYDQRLMIHGGVFLGTGDAGLVYPGQKTSLVFSDGDILDEVNLALVEGELDDITDGESMYEKFCRQNPVDSEDSFQVQKRSSGPGSDALHDLGDDQELVSQHRFEKMYGLVRWDDNDSSDSSDSKGDDSSSSDDSDSLAQNHLRRRYGEENDEHFVDSVLRCHTLPNNDVIVLKIRTFQINPDMFAERVKRCLQRAAEHREPKLIVDLGSNGGGYMANIGELQSQLFPQDPMPIRARYKRHEQLVALAQIESSRDGIFKGMELLTDTAHPNGLGEILGPGYTYEGATFTPLFDELYDASSPAQQRFHAQQEPMPVARENIVLLNNGICSSACAIFAQELMVEFGIRSVGFGGRPVPGRMMGTGGTRTGTVLQFQKIFSMTHDDRPGTTDVATQAVLDRLSDLPIRRSRQSGRIAMRSLYWSDDLQVPANFRTTEDDCRLYLDAATLASDSEKYKAVYGVAFRNFPCVAGNMEPKPLRRQYASPPFSSDEPKAKKCKKFPC